MITMSLRSTRSWLSVARLAPCLTHGWFPERLEMTRFPDGTSPFAKTSLAIAPPSQPVPPMIPTVSLIIGGAFIESIRQGNKDPWLFFGIAELPIETIQLTLLGDFAGEDAHVMRNALEAHSDQFSRVHGDVADLRQVDRSGPSIS